MEPRLLEHGPQPLEALAAAQLCKAGGPLDFAGPEVDSAIVRARDVALEVEAQTDAHLSEVDPVTADGTRSGVEIVLVLALHRLPPCRRAAPCRFAFIPRPRTALASADTSPARLRRSECGRGS